MKFILNFPFQNQTNKIVEHYAKEFKEKMRAQREQQELA